MSCPKRRKPKRARRDQMLASVRSSLRELQDRGLVEHDDAQDNWRLTAEARAAEDALRVKEDEAVALIEEAVGWKQVQPPTDDTDAVVPVLTMQRVFMPGATETEAEETAKAAIRAALDPLSQLSRQRVFDRWSASIDAREAALRAEADSLKRQQAQLRARLARS